ncbi:hypothetical protein [Streptoalloteichus hindustanus]|uniref:Uncharacterized protein n=1 Tax=Streptoalloteichus hindustanus TaxID=2017 RepID=A0A1M5FMR8_STRHI|nr:hypothetical protein [Streptoalloteichus hindustanus]SHF92887.1 hypothetical protein SAMN05444320_105513 [Streptoalloteichus hindustanus]
MKRGWWGLLAAVLLVTAVWWELSRSAHGRLGVDAPDLERRGRR